MIDRGTQASFLRGRAGPPVLLPMTTPLGGENAPPAVEEGGVCHLTQWRRHVYE